MNEFSHIGSHSGLFYHRGVSLGGGDEVAIFFLSGGAVKGQRCKTKVDEFHLRQQHPEPPGCPRLTSVASPTLSPGCEDGAILLL